MLVSANRSARTHLVFFPNHPRPLPWSTPKAWLPGSSQLTPPLRVLQSPVVRDRLVLLIEAFKHEQGKRVHTQAFAKDVDAVTSERV